MPAKSKKKKSFDELSNEELALKGIEYVNKKEAIKELDSQCKECRVPLEDAIETSGKVLATGSKLLVLPHADVDVHLRKTIRIGKVLHADAFEILHSEGLDECIEEVPTIREDVLERLYHEGKVSEDLLKKLYTEKATYAFSVELKERFGDAPE